MVSRLRLCRATQSARASASATVPIASTSTASYSPKIRVDVIGSKPSASPKGFGRSPTIVFPGAVKTFTLSVFDATGAVARVLSFGPFVRSIWHSFRRQCEFLRAVFSVLIRGIEMVAWYRRRLDVMCPSARPIEREMREPGMDPRSTAFRAQPCELHDADGVRGLAVICQDEFGDPKIAATNDSPDGEPLLVRLTGALALYVVSAAGSLA